MMQLSKEAQNLSWLVGSFTSKVPGVAHTIVVSSDGLLLAMSDRLERAQADQLAAVASGVTSLTQGASRIFSGGTVTQTICEMDKGFVLVMPISDGSTLAVLASLQCDIGQVGYEMAVLVAQVGTALTPALCSELQAALPR